MSIVNALSKLKSNLFGGPGNTGFSKPPPSKVQDIGMTPTAVLDSDPLRFGTYQFPKDVFENRSTRSLHGVLCQRTEKNKV